MRVSRQDPKNAKVVVPASSFSSPLGLRVLSEAGVTPIRGVLGGAGGRRNGWACGWKERNRGGEMRVSRQDPKTPRLRFLPRHSLLLWVSGS